MTHDYRVAAWFATNRWASNDPPTSKIGVIYRFDVARLKSLLSTWSQIGSEFAAKQGKVRPLAMFFEDISDIPETFAMRPSRQQGASIYGLGNFNVLRGLLDDGVLEIFEFPQRKETIDLGEINRAFVMPADDPFLSIANRFSYRQATGS